jgi:hypothetical protein
MRKRLDAIDSAAAALEIATVGMIRNDLLSNGLATDDEIEQHLANVRSGALDLSQPPMISVRGRKRRE